MDCKRWYLGSNLSNEPLETAKNYIARQLNHYIFTCNWADKQLNLIALKSIILKNEETELALAARLGKMYDAQSKWEHVKALLLQTG